jgi:hypothetical protein
MSSTSDQQWLRQIGVDLDAASDDSQDGCDEHGGISGAEEGHDTDEDGAHKADVTGGHEDSADSGVVDLDAGPLDDSPPERPERNSRRGGLAPGPRPARRYTPWVLGVFAAAVGLATMATTLGVILSGPDHPSAPRQHRPKSSAVPTPTAAPAPTPPDTADHPLPFTASADCPAGASTSAKSIADPDKPSPWICVRHTEGQPLSITLGPAGIERAYVITAVTVVPGDTAAAQGSNADPWLQHRVVTLLQWQFNDTAHTVIDQDTGNVRGEVVKPIPGISASKITVIIRQTSRPVAAPQTATQGEEGGPLSGILGGPASTTGPNPTDFGSGQDSDPSDGTFAISSIKIIGHKAL